MLWCQEKQSNLPSGLRGDVNLLTPNIGFAKRGCQSETRINFIFLFIARGRSISVCQTKTRNQSCRKTSAIAADQRRTGGGPTTQEPLTDIEIHALFLVRDSNCVTTVIVADPLAQDDSHDSYHSDTDDRPSASTWHHPALS